MLKLPLIVLFIFVICSHSIRHTCCASADDEFAEFDDFSPDETKKSEPEQRNQPQDQSYRSSPRQDHASQKQSTLKKDEPIDLEDLSNKGDDTIAKLKSKEVEEDDEARTKSKPDLKLVNAPLPRIYKWESYYIEIAFLLFLFLYTVNYFLGGNKNNKFAQNWYEQTKELLKQQFALVGGAPQANDGTQKRDDDNGDTGLITTKKQRGLIKTTESLFTLWNSGRVGMDGLLIEINLLKRQDLFSMALNLIKPTKDTLTLRFLLNQDGYENFVFCVAHRTYATKLARDMVDINTFCPKKKPISQFGIDADRLFVMSELSDVATFIFDQKVTSFLKKYEQSINFIHITDQYSTIKSEEALPAQRLAKPKRLATFSFSFPSNTSETTVFILFALSLLDKLRRFKLARDSKQKSDKNRQKITDILQKAAFSAKQEAAQSKKEEQRRLEKERIYNEDDPEKQMKWERKEAKRELKKNKMRVKQLKVKSM